LEEGAWREGQPGFCFRSVAPGIHAPRSALASPREAPRIALFPGRHGCLGRESEVIVRSYRTTLRVEIDAISARGSMHLAPEQGPPGQAPVKLPASAFWASDGGEGRTFRVWLAASYWRRSRFHSPTSENGLELFRRLDDSTHTSSSTLIPLAVRPLGGGLDPLPRPSLRSIAVRFQS